MEEKWSLSKEEEVQLRQSLLRKARKGDTKATQELQKIYNVRIWSEQDPRYRETQETKILKFM